MPRRSGTGKGEVVVVKTLKRIAISLGSLAALALAGAAHWKIG